MPRTGSIGALDFRCEVCNKLFSRQEHLKRHGSVHTQDRLYRCDSCSKQFLRRDALDRHRLTHQSDAQNLLQKGARACSECAAAKIKCSGGKDCIRCQQRSLSCRYPETRKRQRATADHGDSSVVRSDMRLAKDRDSQQAEVIQWHSMAPPNMPNSTGQNVYTDAPSYNPSSEGNTPQAVFHNSLVGNDMQQPHPVDQINYDPETYQRRSYALSAHDNTLNPLTGTWDTSMMSTINWLSDAPLGLQYDDVMNSFPSYAYFSDTNFVAPALHVPSGSQDKSPIAMADERCISIVKPTLSQENRSHRVQSTGGTRSIADDTNSSRSGGRSRGSGTFYLDSSSARQPKGKRRRLSARTTSQTLNANIGHFSLDEPSQIEIIPERSYGISLSKYNDMQQAFYQTCINADSMFQPFSSAEFPSLSYVIYLSQLYFQHFHPNLPMLHAPTFAGEDSSWVLHLAVAAIGCHYVEGENSQAFCNSMHEFMRRLLIVAEENPPYLPEDDVARVQIILLHSIGTSYCGDERLCKSGSKYERELVAFCENGWCTDTTRAAFRRSDRDDEVSTDQTWLSWRDRELRLRAGYSIWLIDCIWVINLQRKPLLSLEDGKPMMPCHESAWESTKAFDWSILDERYLQTPSVLTTIQHLYVEKKLSPNLGEFSRVILIHGLFRRSWEVETYFRQNLSGWEPTVERQSSSELRLESPVWLPGVPEYVKWRNSACDCLDILHWSANATIGNSSGVEHPTVLHLHFARVVLLTPFAHIMNLANFAVGGSNSPHASAVKNDELAIRNWALRDQYKARLAMIHAGVLLWHVRRFSTNAFYEPFSVALAVLALWAFVNFNSKPGPTTESETQSTDHVQNIVADDNNVENRSESRSESEDADIAACSIILIDRPTDDELVQAFVRRGDTMIAHMTGVGNLYGEKGPELVLEQGRKLLCTLNGWGVAQHLEKTLGTLVEMTRRNRAKKAKL